MSEAVAQRLDDLGDALSSCLSVLQDLRRATNFQTEVLLKVLAAVTKEAENSPLEDLLRQLVVAATSHEKKLDAVLAAVTKP